MLQLSDVLPGWVPWVGPVLAVVTMGLVFLVMPVAVVWWALRIETDSLPWTELARRVHVARVSIAFGSLVLPILAFLVATVLVGPLSALGRIPVAIGSGLAVLVGSMLMLRLLNRHIHGRDLGMRQSVIGWMLTVAPVLALFVLGAVAPALLSSWWMIPWLALALVIVWAWLWMPLLMIPMGLARNADARLNEIVMTSSQRAGVEVRRVLEAASPQPNAFAYPWLSTLTFTSGMLEVLSDDELEAITFHELAHLSEERSMTRLRQAQLLAFIPLAAVKPLYGSVGWTGVIIALAGFFVVIEGVRRRSVREEAASDAIALDSSHQSSSFGMALEKTYRIGLIPAVIKRSTHGQLHERLAAAGVERDFEIPKPPTAVPHLIGSVVALVIIVVAAFLPWAAVAVTPDDSSVPSLLAVTMPLYGTGSLENLAWDAESDERWADAAVMYETVADRSGDIYDHFETVRLWASAGECERADTARGHIVSETVEADRAVEWVDWCELTGGMPRSD